MSQCHLVHVYYNFYAFDVCFMDVFPFWWRGVVAAIYCSFIGLWWETLRKQERGSRKQSESNHYEQAHTHTENEWKLWPIPCLIVEELLIAFFLINIHITLERTNESRRVRAFYASVILLCMMGAFIIRGYEHSALVKCDIDPPRLCRGDIHPTSVTRNER